MRKASPPTLEHALPAFFRRAGGHPASDRFGASSGIRSQLLHCTRDEPCLPGCKPLKPICFFSLTGWSV